jgi:DNA-binding response OmpR family regulator
VEVLREARTRWPNLAVLILTAHGSLSSAIEAVRLDAADYLLKPIGLDALRARVAEVLARQRANQQRQERIRHMYQQLQALVQDEGLLPQAGPSGDILQAGPLSLDVPRHQVRMAGQPVELTPSEFAILQTLARANGAVVPCVQLIQSFQSVSMEEDEARQVMRPHIVRLRRKIEPDPQRPVYIQSVRGVGYRWNGAGEGGGEE